MGARKFQTGDRVIARMGIFKSQPGEVRGYDLSRRTYLVKFRVNGENTYRSFPAKQLEVFNARD